MLILAADTSLPILSVALVRDGGLVAATAMEGKSSRNEKLLPAIDWLLKETATDRASIDLFAVTRGPGSFTGVRIGLATMQGMAMPAGKPVCAMSTHEAMAPHRGRWLIVDEAGRGELYVSLFENGEELRAPFLARPDEVASIAAERLVVRDFLQDHNVALLCAKRAAEVRDADALARYADITPIYVRLSEAEVKLGQQSR